MTAFPRPIDDRATANASWQEKGKMRARDEGAGAMEGVVLDLNLVGDGIWQAIYTVPVLVGRDSAQKQFDLQVDTGSADLWIASSSCSTSACGGAKGHVYDPKAAQASTQTFDITYLAGSASGPIVWDTVQLGGYSIEFQALAAAAQVAQEPLTPAYNGLLGLALQLDSLIAEAIPPTTSDAPDGAVLASNIFGITPASAAPAARFLSLALARPGSDRVASTLGVGRHPAALVPDPSQVKYGRLVADAQGSRFWKTSVRSLSVWVNGEERVVDVGRSRSGALFPTAVLDSGVPVILTTSYIANGIYGAIGVGPAADGSYYVPCDQPLNITITLGTTTPQVIPLHPLDLTAYPPSSQTPASMNCIGLIQSADSVLGNPISAPGDMILGVPFLRNVYTVMAYAAPDADGSFTTSAASSAAAIDPRLGLLPLTDPTIALAEFNTVRVMNQPLPSTNGGNGGTTDKSGANRAAQNKGLSIGLKVLIGLGVFFALCAFLFMLRWLLMRRRFRREARIAAAGANLDGTDKAEAYAMYDRRSVRTSDDTKAAASTLSGDTLRGSGARSKLGGVGAGPDEFGLREADAADAVHAAPSLRGEDPWDPQTALFWPAASGTAGSAGVGAGGHRRAPSDTPLLDGATQRGHARIGSETPLLGHARVGSRSSDAGAPASPPPPPPPHPPGTTAGIHEIGAAGAELGSPERSGLAPSTDSSIGHAASYF